MPAARKTSKFIGEPIRVGFEKEPPLTKTPGCPSWFEWRGETYRVSEVLAEWHAWHRRGTAQAEAAPAQPSELSTHRGSWGVGKTFFRVNTEAGRVFVIYYDRAPRSVDDRKGTWLLREETIGPPEG